MEERLDIIVFGATGFTGKHTLPYLYRLNQKLERKLTWGIAGRSEKKLKEILRECDEKLGVNDFKSVPILIADVNDEASILEMAKKANVVINCCGPYQLYGEVVVRCCVEASTDYVDVTGEALFQEEMLTKYQSAAQRKSVYIVPSCGFDSIGSEIPMNFLSKKFQGTLNSVEVFYHNITPSNRSGSVGNYGTYASIVNTLGSVKSLLALKKSSDSIKLSPTCSLRIPFSKDTNIGIPNKRIVPFPSPDAYAVNRSQRYLYESYGKRPVQIRHYYLIDSWINILLMFFFGMIIFVIGQFQCGRELLLKHPKIFTGGFFDHKSPSEEVINKSEFGVYFYGKGWKKTDGESGFNKPPNQSILAKMRVVNPGYGFTCLAVALSAITILTERQNLPDRGGVYTPAFTFFNTSFVEEFQKNGVELDILSVSDL